jgi:RNA polymerase sigma-70 factor (ECF subfamily)
MVQTTAQAQILTKRAGISRADLQALEDSQLVQQHLGGETRAFEVLVDRYQARLLNFVYRIVGDRERSEDLVQEAFIRVHRHLARFDRSKKFSTWIYTIASNLAKNELRNRARSPLVLFTSLAPQWDDDERPLEFEDSGAQPDEAFRRNHLKEAVERSVAQ